MTWQDEGMWGAEKTILQFTVKCKMAGIRVEHVGGGRAGLKGGALFAAL